MYILVYTNIFRFVQNERGDENISTSALLEGFRFLQYLYLYGMPVKLFQGPTFYTACKNVYCSKDVRFV